VLIWDAVTGRELARLRAPALAISLAFAAGGRLAVGDLRGGVTIWSSDGALERTFHAGRRAHVAFSADGGRLVTASGDRVARVFDSRTGRLELTLRGHRRALTSARFSPDGSTIVTASGDHDARLWDASTGRLLRVLRGHYAVISDAEFSPDGRWVVTAGPTTAGLWDVRSGELLFFLRGHAARLTSATFDPSSRRILTASIDGTARTYVCDVCGGLDELVAIAEQRVREAGGS
jgi:WD40 repeat protein